MLLLCCSCLLWTPIKVHADSLSYLYEGYTLDNVHYTVYCVSSDTASPNFDSQAIYLNRLYVYDAIVNPPITIYHTESINGRTYKGTLSLYQFGYTHTTTEAFYHGYVFPYD